MQRRLLMAIVYAFKWLAQSFTNLYYSLIPTTISGKSVKNKAKISKIYGDSVVENQLVQNGNFVDGSNWDITNANNLLFTNNICSCTNSNVNAAVALRNTTPANTISGHKYLILVDYNFDSNIGSNIVTAVNGFNVGASSFICDSKWHKLSIIQNSTGGVFIVYIRPSATTGNLLQFANHQLIDLTQMFPFDTPTTLTDVRVQALLNRGYIEYSTGEIKSVDISEFSSEPYNLFDGELEGGGINTSTGQNLNVLNNFRTKNYIKVISGTNYLIEWNYTDLTSTTLYVFEYDKDYNFIQVSTKYNSNYAITFLQNTSFIRLQFYKNNSNWRDNVPTNANVCVHLQGTRTDYAPYTQSQTLPFIYQGSGAGTSHDTFEITSSEYVFTKNMGSVDLGSLNWNKSSNHFYATVPNNTKKPSDNSIQANILCSNYTSNIANNVNSEVADKGIALSAGGSVAIYDSSKSTFSATDFKTAMSGVILEYELATPQVIRIPKKHLGVVDLGSLSWGNSTSYGGNQISQVIFNNGVASTDGNEKANMFCNRYTIGTRNDNIATTGYITYSKIGNNNYLSICLGSTTMTSLQYQQALAGIYLFYETESEVADIETKVGIEAGGTLTSDSDVLPNVDVLVKCK